MTNRVDECNIGGIEIILNGVSVKLKIIPVYVLACMVCPIPPQIMGVRG